MTLATQIQQDIRTFLNVDEFAKTRTINGAAVACVLSKDEFLPEGDMPANMGIYNNAWTLECATAALPIRPRPGRKMLIDGMEFHVVDSRDTDGMLQVNLTEVSV